MNDYYYRKLDTIDKRYYTHILNSILRGQYRVILSPTTISRLSVIVSALFNDHPEIFWLHPETYEIENHGHYMILQTSPLLSATEIKRTRERYTQIASTIREHTRGKSQYNILITIHQYLLKNVKYDNDEVRAIGACIAGPILWRKGKCSGIARTTKLFCDMLNIPCIIVCGVANGNDGVEEHAWNMVNVKGKWAHLDVTWDITLGEGEKRYDYLCLTDEELSYSHSWKRTLVPVCDSPEINFHYEVGCYYNTIDEAMVSIYKSLQCGNKSVVGKIKNKCKKIEFLKYLDNMIHSRINLQSFRYTVHFNEYLCVYRIQLMI